MALKLYQSPPLWVGEDISERPDAARGRPGAQFKVGDALYEVALVSGVRTWKRKGFVEQVTLGAAEAGLARTLTIDTQVDEQQRAAAVDVFLAPASGRTLTLTVGANGRLVASTATMVRVSKSFAGALVVTLTADAACSSTYEVWVDGKPVTNGLAIAFT